MRATSRLTVLAILGAAGLAVLLAGCGTSPTQTQAPAAVEDRKPGADGGKPVETSPVKPIDVTGGPSGSALAPLKDPANILSKRSIYYDFDKFDVKDEFRGLVEAHAKYLRENPAARMLIQGNTDERGSREYNVGLGQRRSDSLRKMMTLLGVKETQIESVSLGEEKPACSEHSEDCWAKNRRGEVLYSGEY